MAGCGVDQGMPIDGKHYVAEHKPEATFTALHPFLAS
jgi:hypothetical protein